MTAPEVKDKLGPYVALLLYPQTAKQDKEQLPYTPGYFRMAKLKKLEVKPHRIDVIRENIRLHIEKLQELDRELAQSHVNSTHI